MDRGVSIFIDPTGAQTGGRVVKRELKEIGDAAVNAQKMTDQLSRAQMEAAKAAQASTQMTAQQLEMLRAKYNPVFAVIQRYKAAQDEIRMAYRNNAFGANEMANALSRERQGALAAIQAIKGHTTALHANNSAMRQAAAQRANLIFQLNDIFVSLASGMNPGMVLIQQGSQISQIYGGQGGVVAALRETANMAGNVATKFRVAGIAGGIAAALLGNGLAHVKAEAEAALGATVTWGEVFSATLDVVWGKLKGTFGPAVSALMDPLFYAFEKLASATTDFLEWGILGFKIFFRDIGFLWDTLPDIVGAAFVGAVNIAINHLNKLSKASSDAVDLIIEAFNNIPGVDIPQINSSGQAISPIGNPYAERLARAWGQHEEGTRAIGREQPIRGLGRDIAAQIGTNRASGRLSDFADMDFSQSIQGANSLSQAVGGVGAAWQQAKSAVVDVNQQMADARRNTLAGFEQSSKQLRTMKTELKEIQATLAAAAQTPVADVFGTGMSGQAAGAIDAAASSIGKVFAALNDGRLTAQGAHEALELIRASLLQLGGDSKSVNAWVDSVINAYFHVGNLESRVKSLSAEIMGIPNRVISIGIQEYTVPSAGGGSTGVRVHGGNADFSYQQYQVGGGKTVGVSGGNGYYGRQTGYLVTQDDIDTMNSTLGYSISGARAAGGPVSAGGTYLVGEQGPELLTMSGAGSVANTNATASILSGGRDALSLIEDHLFNVVQELRIHTNYWETAESNDQEMIACLKALKAASGSVSYSGGSSYSGGGSSSRGSYSGGSSGGGSSHLDPYSAYYFNAARNFAGTGGGRYDPVADAMLNGNTAALNGVSGGPTQGIARLLSGHNMPSLLDRLKRQVGFANNGQIMAGEDQKVEFFKRNKERVIIVDDNRVSDQRGKESKAERPINLTVNFNGGDVRDQRSQQAAADQFRRVVQQVQRS